MSGEAARADRELQMLEAMVDCAHELALALGEAAKAEAAGGGQAGRVDAFLRCFQAARLGVRLCLTLRSGRAAASMSASAARETPQAEAPEPLEAERLEPSDADRPEREAAERDRDYEPVSLPKFLASLRAAAAAAGDMHAELPAHIGARTLPALGELLAEAGAGPPALVADAPGGDTVLVLRRIDTRSDARPRSRLMGSATALAPPRPSG